MDQLKEAACLDTISRATPVHRKNYFNTANSILDKDGVYWNDRLVELCSYGDTRSVVELVNKVKQCHKDFSIDCCHSKNGDTGLIAAAKNRRYECIELLLHLGADPTVRNTSGETVLNHCTEDTQLRSLIMTADNRLPSTAKSALAFSTWIGNSELFNKFLHLTDVDLKNIDKVRNANGTPLLLLAITDIDLLSNLIKDSNIAAEYRPDEIVAKLIDCGVNVNVSDVSSGKTSLHYLSSIDSDLTLNIMRLIIETKHADLSARDADDNMPLHSACSTGNEAAAVLLLHEGADINAKGEGGQTPLHMTASIGSQDLVRILLDCGADVTLIDDRGLTPFDLANDTVVRYSLREAWTEATSRKRSTSSDVDSSLDAEDRRLARSAGDAETLKSSLRSIRSLPVLPAISPATSPRPSLTSSVKLLNMPQSTSDDALASLETLLNKNLPKQVSLRSATKPRLRRWRSTSAGMLATQNAGVRLPPLHMAVFEVGLSTDGKKLNLRPHTTSSEPTGQSDSESESTKGRKIAPKTLQTTMPCRVSVSALMVLGAKPPQLSNDMALESVSARSVKTPKEPSKPKPKPQKQPPVAKSNSASCNGKMAAGKAIQNCKVSNAAKGPNMGPRRHSMTSFSPERVVTVRPSLPKLELAASSSSDYCLTQSDHRSSMIDRILQPHQLKIEPIYASSDYNSSEDEMHKRPGKCSAKSSTASKPAAKKKKCTSTNNSSKTTYNNNNLQSKKSKKKQAKLAEETTIQNGDEPKTLILDNGVSLRLPIDNQPLNEDVEKPIEIDQNSLRALSDIIQLSTVVEEDEMLASLRSSYAKMTTPQRGLTPPLVNSSQRFIEPLNESEEVEIGSSDDAGSVSTLTPEAELTQMEEEMAELGQIDDDQPDENLTIGHHASLQPLVVDDEDDEDQQQRSPLRSASRASSTRNPVVFQEDQSLLAAATEDGPDYSSSSMRNLNAVRASLRQEMEAQPPIMEKNNNSHQDDAQEQLRSSSRLSQMSNDLQQSIRWRKGNEIGHGGYGKVYLALTSLGGLIAVKQIDTSRFNRDAIEKEYERIDEEINILRALKHPSIVEFYGTSFEGDVVNIFMEFIAGGSIASILRRFGALEELVFRRYTKQLLKAVRYLHGNGIVHRDIKGANVMVTGEGLIKLIDFGCARRLVESAAVGSSFGPGDGSGHHQLISAKGTPYWMAPEVICETGHGRKSDIWSIGCTVFEMATRRPPWADLEPSAAMFAIASGRKPIPQLQGSFSNDACSFVAMCLQRSASSRPTAAELLEHKWFLASASTRRNPVLSSSNNRQRLSAASVGRNEHEHDNS